MKERIRGIIFDCDGVLFESRQANLAFYNAVLAELGAEPVLTDQEERVQLCHTAASPEVFAGLLGAERVPRALAIAERLEYRQFIPWMDPEPGMRDALESLSAVLPLAVATNRGFSMPQILEHFSLQGYFQTVVTSRDVDRPKPFPDMLFEAACRLDVPVGDLLFVGDSHLDQAAAKAAGMPFANYRGDLAADLRIVHHRQLVELFVL
ncbi:MAG: HAD family hydrolase [Desulfuromonadales bacterium]|nr:HAD family hydrolase [Desulfuromonadales bacterium]